MTDDKEIGEVSLWTMILLMAVYIYNGFQIPGETFFAVTIYWIISFLSFLEYRYIKWRDKDKE